VGWKIAASETRGGRRLCVIRWAVDFENCGWKVGAGTEGSTCFGLPFSMGPMGTRRRLLGGGRRVPRGIVKGMFQTKKKIEKERKERESELEENVMGTAEAPCARNILKREKAVLL